MFLFLEAFFTLNELSVEQNLQNFLKTSGLSFQLLLKVVISLSTELFIDTDMDKKSTKTNRRKIEMI